MELTSNEVNGVLVVALTGRLTVVTADAFKRELDHFCEKASKIVLDCTKMEYIDSTGLGIVVRFFKDFTGKGGKLALAGLQPKPKLVFEITRAYKIFDIFDSAGAAVESLK